MPLVPQVPKPWSDRAGDPNALVNAAALIDLEMRLDAAAAARVAAAVADTARNVRAFSGDPAGTPAANKAALLADFEALRGENGGTLLIPNERFDLDPDIPYPIDVPVLVRGEGYASEFHCASDAGAGEWFLWEDGVRASDNIGETFFMFLRITSSSPDPVAVALNTKPVDMGGLRLGAKCNTWATQVEGFADNIGLNGDHQLLGGRTRSSFGYYNLTYLAGTPTNGDQHLDGLDLTQAKRTSLHIEPGGQCFANTWVEVHLGFAPFGIEMDGHINDLTAVGLAIEGFGNMEIRTPSGFAEMFGCTLLNASGSYNAGYNVPALPDDYGVQLARFQRNVLITSEALLKRPAGGLGCFAVSNADGHKGTYWIGVGDAIEVAAASGTQIFMDGGYGDSEVWSNGNRYRIQEPPNVAIQPYELLERTGRETVQKAAGGTAVGVAAHSTGATWQKQLVQIAGNTPIKYASATPCAAGDTLKPDPANSGAVVKAASPHDGQTVAVANGAPAGGYVEATLSISPRSDSATIYMPGGEFEAVSGSPARGLVGGSRQLAWLLDAAAAEVVGCELLLPPKIGKFDLYVWWTNAGAGVGNVRWGSFRNFIADGAGLNVSDVDEAVTAAAPTQDTLKRTKLIAGASVTADGRILRVRIRRDATDAVNDTLANDAALIGVEIVPVI